jgi:hypothetical protein
MFKDDRLWDPGLLQRTLAEQAKDLASLTMAFGGALQRGPANPDAFRNPLIERYRQLFIPPGLAAAGGGPANAGAAFLRYQQAMQAFTAQVSAIAMNAGERLAAALARSEPEAPPITTLRELHALWVDCGEAAYAAAAHRDEFAEAQAELLAAFVELRAGLASP